MDRLAGAEGGALDGFGGRVMEDRAPHRSRVVQQDPRWVRAGRSGQFSQGIPGAR